MSYDEKEKSNSWRFSREISLGDIMLILPIIWLAAGLQFKVEDHEKRITAAEQIIDKHEQRLGEHDTAIAVLTVKIK
jgi:hypothetical protein